MAEVCALGVLSGFNKVSVEVLLSLLVINTCKCLFLPVETEVVYIMLASSQFTSPVYCCDSYRIIFNIYCRSVCGLCSCDCS